MAPLYVCGEKEAQPGEQGPRIQTLARGRDSNAGSGWGALQRRPRGKQGARWPWLPVRWCPLCRPTLEAQTERREAVGCQSSPEVIFSSLDCPRELSDLTSGLVVTGGGWGKGPGRLLCHRPLIYSFPASLTRVPTYLRFPGLQEATFPSRRAGTPGPDWLSWEAL